jgi:hypothetical protein
LTNYFTILELTPQAGSEDVKSAFRHLAKKWHPDRNKDPHATRRFIEITEAYEYLMDDNRRSVHAFMLTNRQNVDEELERKARIYQEWYEQHSLRTRQRAEAYAKGGYSSFKKSPMYKAAMTVSKVYNYLFLLFCAVVLIAPILGWYNNSKNLPIDERQSAAVLIVPIALGLIFAGFGYYYLFVLKTDED